MTLGSSSFAMLMWARVWQAFFMIVQVLERNSQEKNISNVPPLNQNVKGCTDNQSWTACQFLTIFFWHLQIQHLYTGGGYQPRSFNIWTYKLTFYAELYSRKALTALCFSVLSFYYLRFHFFVNRFAKLYKQPISALWLSGSEY